MARKRVVYVRHVSAEGDHPGMFESFDLSDPDRRAALEALGKRVVEVDPRTGEPKK